jgi:hypothetical protein
MGILPDRADHGARELRLAGELRAVVDRPRRGARGAPTRAGVVTAHGPAPHGRAERGHVSVSPAVPESSCPLAITGTDPTMDAVQVKKDANCISDRIPDIHW